ncbi:MAG: serine acetyltransferase [Lachnospiraceae bacterium]|nr:serine acetyltransferase [Lachnospiraceae bacterium]
MDKELKKLIASDLKRIGKKNCLGLLPEQKYLVLWRKASFYCKKGGFLRKWYGIRLDAAMRRTFIELPREVKAGYGIYLGHSGNRVIHPDTILGNNINIASGVNIGMTNRGNKKGTPVIGNDVWIGTNAVIVGNIKIGNDVLIAPGAYVNTDIPDHSIVIGNPAVIKPAEHATEGYINNKA